MYIATMYTVSNTSNRQISLTQNTNRGIIRVTHVLSLVLSRSSFDSIISDQPARDLSLARSLSDRSEHLSCGGNDYYTKSKYLDPSLHPSDGLPRGVPDVHSIESRTV